MERLGPLRPGLGSNMAVRHEEKNISFSWPMRGLSWIRKEKVLEASADCGDMWGHGYYGLILPILRAWGL